MDALRAFSLKLGRVTASVSLRPCTFDPELEGRHEATNTSPARLVVTSSKHVDDVKLGAEKEVCEEIIKAV